MINGKRLIGFEMEERRVEDCQLLKIKLASYVSFDSKLIALISKTLHSFYIPCVTVFEAMVMKCTDGGLAQVPCEFSSQVGRNVHCGLLVSGSDRRAGQYLR